MEQTLLKLKPELLWKHFLEITKIPHGSGNEAAIAQYVINIAKENGLKYKQDKSGNVVILKPATPGLENHKTVIVQSHMDMICDKNKDVVHDFTKDPLKLKLEGNILKACGTTLGADNGVGVAAELALAEDKTIKHGPLELLFTVEEETALVGAQKMSGDFLTGRIMINLDSEVLGVYFIGCAGGQDTDGVLKLSFTKTNIANPVLIKIEVKGLVGGHSGVDIDKERANALKLLARILYKVNNSMKMDIVSMEGGTLKNAIPREGFAQVVVSKADLVKFEEIVKQCEKKFKFEYKNTESGLTVNHIILKDAPNNVIVNEQKNKIVNLLEAFPQGVFAMSLDLPGLVETSGNLGVVLTEADIMKIKTSQRSFIESAKNAASDTVIALFALAGFESEIKGGYPEWTPNVKSPLVEICKKVNEKILKKAAVITAIHAGMECGVIGEKYPGIDMVSMGATFAEFHSPNEYLEVDSVEPFWSILTEIILEAGKCESGK